jgi:hypothetical protein
MLFETHVTIDYDKVQDLGNFKEVCVFMRVKPLIFTLLGEKIKHPHHVMCTEKFESKDANTSLIKACALIIGLKSANFDTIRVKIETPLSLNNTNTFPYHEAHWKINIPDLKGAVKLNKFLKKQKDLSVSALNGSTNQYLTVRCYNVTSAKAVEKFNKLSKVIQLALLKVESCHYETAVVDTNIGLDEGWV